MAFRKVHRTDGRASFLPCSSSVTVTIFVGLCLVGVWVLTSSSITPSDLYNLESMSSIKESTSGEDSKRDTSLDGNDLSSTQRQHATKPVNDWMEQDRPSEEEINEERKIEENTIMSDSKKDKSSESEDEDNMRSGEGLDTSVNKTSGYASLEVLPNQSQSEFHNETGTHGGYWSTNGTDSRMEGEEWKSFDNHTVAFELKLCNSTAGPDYIPCLDNVEAILKLPSTKHYEHRERHCPNESPTCLVPLPKGYKRPLKWPQSREKIWYANAPHTKLIITKGHQNWVKEDGKYLTFPGGGTQFKRGALHYIDFIQKSFPDIAWGEKSRVVLDVGCGVASFGGFLFERNVITMSFAPKDEHEAQVQFALERGIPAVLAVMGTKRLPFPSMAFDVVHCARCRVPWHIEGGVLLLELNRVLRPGGYFVWSATPVYDKSPEDVGIWKAMSKLTKSMCWDMVTRKRTPLDKIGLAIYRKPLSNNCYKKRSEKSPPLCPESDDSNAAWNVPLEACLHRLPESPSLRGTQWPEQWPFRLENPPHWLNSSLPGLYGKVAPQDFKADYEHWKRVVNKFYLTGMGIDWSTVRNVMDMRSVYGGFAAALKDINVWVMNVVPIDSADTLPVIYDRGLFGIYHDWCESFSTYPRSYDLLHADHLFSELKTRCSLLSVVAEVDRILRPEGKVIIRDDAKMIDELVSITRSMQWEIRLRFSKGKEGFLCLQKSWWRPQVVDGSQSTI